MLGINCYLQISEPALSDGYHLLIVKPQEEWDCALDTYLLAIFVDDLRRAFQQITTHSVFALETSNPHQPAIFARGRKLWSSSSRFVIFEC